MRYFHCPTIFARKPYGCGAGPYNATVAMLDFWGKCRCGKALKPYKPVVESRAFPVTATRCSVTSAATGLPYCDGAVVSGAYCARHAYLNIAPRS